MDFALGKIYVVAAQKSDNTQAVYSGLESGHTYVVTIQPTVNGKAEGNPGSVSFVTPK